MKGSAMGMINKIVLLCLLCWFNQEVMANQDSLKFYLPPLEQIISSSLKNSPLLKQIQTEEAIKAKDFEIEKRKWMNCIYIDGAATYGLFDRLVTEDYSTSSSSSSGVLSQSEQTTYYAGVGLKLPLSALTNRSRELGKITLEIEKVQYELSESERQLKHLIIELYFNLKYLEESMYNCYEIYQTLNISYQKAKKDLYSGRTNINDFAILSSTVGKAKNDYLKVQNSFWAEYKKLESITGLKFKDLNKVK